MLIIAAAVVMGATVPAHAFASQSRIGEGIVLEATRSCDNPMTLTNSLEITLRNDSDRAVILENLGSSVPIPQFSLTIAPGQAVYASVHGYGPYYLKPKFGITLLAQNEGEAGSTYLSREFPLLTCLEFPPSITYAVGCDVVDVAVSLAGSAPWPFFVNIHDDLGTNFANHTVVPGETFVGKVTTRPYGTIDVYQAARGPLSSYTYQRPANCGQASGGSGGGVPPAGGSGGSGGTTGGAGSAGGQPGSSSTPSETTSTAGTSASPTTASSSSSRAQGPATSNAAAASNSADDNRDGMVILWAVSLVSLLVTVAVVAALVWARRTGRLRRPTAGDGNAP